MLSIDAQYQGVSSQLPGDYCHKWKLVDFILLGETVAMFSSLSIAREVLFQVRAASGGSSFQWLIRS